MSKTVVKIENLSKTYRLGQVGTGTLSHDLNRWWHKIRGKEDPYLKIGETNDRSTKGNSDYVYALKNINIEVKEGEILGIIGQNGAGKSTLLKILSKVTGPTTGSIKTRGRIASLLEVGTGFHPELTGRENIYMNGTIMGMTRKEIGAKLDEIVDFAGVERYLDTPTKRYSSGMTVRLGFAVAAHLEPEILIVDEVLAVGDAEFQKKAIGKMKDVSEGQGRTVLFVSHNMASINNLCGRCVLLKNGKVELNDFTEKAISVYLEDSQINKNISNLKLIDRKDREGNGKLIFSDIKITNKNNIEIESAVSGQEVNIYLKFIVNDLEFTKEIDFVIGIIDPDGRHICNLNSYYSKKKFSHLIEYKSIKCNIPNLPLAAGKYIINAWAGYKRSCYDYITQASVMSVNEGDFYGTGLVGGYKQGLLVYHSWVSNKYG